MFYAAARFESQMKQGERLSCRSEGNDMRDP